MFSKKLLFLVFSMAVGFSCQAMEEQQPEMLKIKCIGVKCIGGKISIPKHIAEQAKAVRDCFSDSEEDQGNIVKVKHLGISKATAEKVFDCIRNKRNIKELQPNEINEVFEVADALGVPQWCLRKLTLRGKKILTPENQHPKITCDHYLNSMRSLYNEGLLPAAMKVEFDENDCMRCILDLKRKNLDTLQGIEQFAEQYKGAWVTKVNLKKNKLKILDITQLLSLFPDLQELKINKNCLKKIIVPSVLPYGFKLNLAYNCLEKLPLFKVGENGEVNLTKNPLTQQARYLAEYAIQPTLLEGQRPRIKAFLDKRTYRYFLPAFTGPWCGFAISYLYGIVPDENFNMMLSAAALGSLSYGLIWVVSEYRSVGYHNNLIHQFKPGTVILDEEENKE